ncbi:protein amnionless-like [Asterias amurensis]|uniref:protein amnionless-like n=1 Tax=Asterias amurensis TaxID=7602 RepID=UPI003AB7E57D
MKTLLILLSFLGVCSCSSKQWKSNVNFNNPKNWDSGKLPCANNRIVFPDTVQTVLLQTNISSVKEIILPNNGQLLMLNDMVLSFSDTPSDADCSSEDVNFISPDFKNWFDPDNWQDLDALVTVETERVPCQYDSVLFPEDQVFAVNVDASATIGRMSFSGKDKDTSQFNYFRNGPDGKLQFSESSASITIQGSACPKDSGCACGNDDPDTLKRICDQYSCMPISCADAVTPIGGCCPLCGAILVMDYDVATFNLADFNNRMHDDYHVHDTPNIANNRRKRREVDTGEVDIYTSMTSTGQIQMVLTDKESGSSNGQKAITLGLQIMTDIQNDPESFGVVDVVMHSSKDNTGAQGSVTGGAVAGIIIAVIIVVIVISTFGFIFLRRRSTFFTKDMPLNADVDMSPGIPAGFMEELPGHPPAIHMQSFDNPVYNTPSMQDNLYSDPTKILTDIASGDAGDLKKSGKKGKKGKGLPPSVENLDQLDDINGFDNPIYATVVKIPSQSVEVKMSPEDQHDGVEGFSNVGFDMSTQETDS